MPLLVNELSIWEIGLRWAGHDPDRVWLRFPLPVKDNFSTLMDAILKGELACITITLEKRRFEPEEKELSSDHWLEDMYACIGGKSFNRKLLGWALIDRFDFKLWCERMNAPLPEFWFPAGWNLEYDLPEGHLPPGYSYYRRDWTGEDWKEWQKEQDALQAEKTSSSTRTASNDSELSQDQPPASSKHMTDAADKMRPNQEARVACQQIAKVIWQNEPDRTIASVVRDELIQKFGGGSFYVDETVREWVKVVAPPDVKDRRGRPKKGG